MILTGILYIELDCDLSQETYDLEFEEELEETSLEIEDLDSVFLLDAEESQSSLSFDISDISEYYDFDLDICYIVRISGGDEYEGPYVIDPKFYNQYLETKNKIMVDDVTVNQIEVSRISNVHGGITVYIGGVF